MAVKKSENKTMSGGSLSLSISPSDKITSYRFTRAKREESGSVRAYWHEHKKAKRHAVTVGSGDPETSLKGVYTDKDAAEAAAKSDLARRGRQKETLSITLPGRPEIVAEAQLTVSGFRSGIDGAWNITSVEHEIGSSGYACTLEAERTNAGAFSGSASATDKIEGEDDHADEANDDGSGSQ
jgi:phage protein D